MSSSEPFANTGTGPVAPWQVQRSPVGGTSRSYPGEDNEVQPARSRTHFLQPSPLAGPSPLGQSVGSLGMAIASVTQHAHEDLERFRGTIPDEQLAQLRGVSSPLDS